MKKPLLSVAPMVDWTDRHFRYFIRQLAPKSLLYTEMHTTGAINFGKEDYILAFDPAEKPLSLQIAGDNPSELAKSIQKAEKWPYDEYNLNCGCPSDKVQSAHYGACLMAEGPLVSSLIKSMKDATDRPVTVKHRVGIQGYGLNLTSYQELCDFVGLCKEAGADRMIIHARIAILEGLNPKENREIPPLRYEDVWQIKKHFPTLTIEINGGIKTIDDLKNQLPHVDGVMIGRAAYEDPYFMTEAERLVFGDSLSFLTRRWVLEKMLSYFDEWETQGLKPHKIYRHMTALFLGFRGARKWRQLLSPPYKSFSQARGIIEEGLKFLPADVLDTTQLRPVSQ